MSDEDATPEVTENEAPDLQTEVDKWKALSRKNEDGKNAALGERDQLKAQIEELNLSLADQSALQEQINTLTETLNSTKSELSSVRLEGVKSNVARKYGLSDDVIEFLTGDDEETLTSKAEKLKNLSSPKEESNSKFLIQSEGQEATPLNSPDLTNFLQEKLGLN